MKHLLRTVPVILWALCSIASADSPTTASTQAEKLVGCMKAFDAGACAPLIYFPYFEKQGADLAQFRKATAEQNEKLKSAGAHYIKFDLSPPGKLYSGNEKLYVIIPYATSLKLSGRRISKESFFVGVSEDKGITWRFIEGYYATQQSIHDMIPVYDDAPLPMRGLRFSQ